MAAPALERQADDTGPDGTEPPAALCLDLGKAPGVPGIGHAPLARNSLGLTMSRTGGIIAGVSPLATSAFAVHATRPVGANGMLQVTLAQPLRVEEGDAQLSVPVGHTKDGGILRHKLQADVTSTGRQVDLAVRWERSLAEGDFRLGAVLAGRRMAF